MDRHDIMRDRLLRADGIDPGGVSGVERARFRRLLSPAEAGHLSGRRCWTSSLAKLAVAAAMVIATARAKTFLWTGTSALVWATVLRKVKYFDTCVYRTREVTTTGPRPDGFEFATETETKEHRSETYGSFSETYENGKLTIRRYTSLRRRQHLFFSERRRHKACFRGPVSDEGIREFHTNDPRRTVAKILAGKYVELGTDVIEGKAVRGVELRDPRFLVEEEDRKRALEVEFPDDFAARFWIDVQTELPVWMEISIVFKGSSIRTTQILDQFEWGVPLEETLFEPEIPADYEVHDDDPSHKAPDAKPKTPAEEAFAQQTLAEAYLGDFDHLPLPDICALSLLGVDPSAPKPQVRLLGDTKIKMAVDECVARWPRYERVKDQLQRELQAARGIDALEVNALVTTGIALRNRFWDLGGCLSDLAYPSIYAARLLEEIAHDRAPENEAIIDQLMESIMSYEVFYYEEDPVPEPRKRNPLYTGLLADLRGAQYRLLKAKVGQGHVPTWKDFVRGCDLIMLSHWRKDDALASEVARLLVEQAPKVGWTYDYYLDRLKRCAEAAVGPPVTFVYAPIDVAHAPYARRLWSFQGPPEYRHHLLPAHLKYLRGW
jgi:hypothetical protein